MDEDDVEGLVQAATNEAVEAAIQAALEVVGEGVAQLARNLGQVTDRLSSAVNDDNGSASARQQMFQDLGRNAQLSMTNSYGQFVTRQEGAASRTHYRAGEDRLAGGILLEALGRSSFFEATEKGLQWGNIGMLDDAAAHWHRIAFGAGGRGQGAHDNYTVDFGSLVGTALSLDDSPSPGFSMPAGVFVDPGSGARVSHGASPRGSDEFYPQSSRSQISTRGGTRTVAVRGRPTGLRPTAGIAGKNFFDAGVRRIARDLPDALEKYVTDIYGDWVEAARRGQAPSTAVTVRTRTSGQLAGLEI